MAVEITKLRRVYLKASGTRTETKTELPRAEFFTLPEGAIDVGDGVYQRCTLLEDRDIFEVWQVTEVERRAA